MRKIKKTKEKKQKKKGICIKTISDYDWRISTWKNPDGSILHYLSRLYHGQFKGKIICSTKQLKDLKKFMAERKFS